jgi:hypothetical protein
MPTIPNDYWKEMARVYLDSEDEFLGQWFETRSDEDLARLGVGTLLRTGRLKVGDPAVSVRVSREGVCTYWLGWVSQHRTFMGRPDYEEVQVKAKL